MMNPDSSPFTPGKPVDAEFFTGRRAQVEKLLAMVRTARKKGLQVGWISGERGMGKSSLASFVGYLAERDEQAVVAHVHLGGVKTLEELVRETHLQLLKDNENKTWGKALWGMFEEHVERVGMFGVEIRLKVRPDDLTATVSSFSNALGNILQKAGGDRKVLVLIFDDINGLADNPKFPHWLKSMVDSEVTSKRDNRICLIFAGLEERLRKMTKENPSVIRVFQPLIDVKPWTTEESENFFQNSFAKGQVTIGERETAELVRYSEGLPIVAHHIGRAVWETAKANKITFDNVHHSLLVSADHYGERFLKGDVIQALQSKHYRSILRKIAKHINLLEVEFSKEQLRALPLTSDEKKNLDNFLNRMRKLGAIVPAKDGDRGVYRFTTYMHRFYFFLEALDATSEERADKT